MRDHARENMGEKIGDHCGLAYASSVGRS